MAFFFPRVLNHKRYSYWKLKLSVIMTPVGIVHVGNFIESQGRKNFNCHLFPMLNPHVATSSWSEFYVWAGRIWELPVGVLRQQPSQPSESPLAAPATSIRTLQPPWELPAQTINNLLFSNMTIYGIFVSYCYKGKKNVFTTQIFIFPIC